jgi:hypothetical protein
MLRYVGALLAVLALLFGLPAAPYTHAHHAIDSVSDEHHPHGESLVHTHASPHSHHDPAGSDHAPADEDKEEREEQIWAVKGFLFQQPVASHAASPVLLVSDEPLVQLTRVWVGAPRMQPPAHGPPVGCPSGLRAPPAFLPTFA